MDFKKRIELIDKQINLIDKHLKQNENMLKDMDISFKFLKWLFISFILLLVSLLIYKYGFFKSF